MVVSAALHPFRPSFPLLRLSIFNSLNLTPSTQQSQFDPLNKLSQLSTHNSTHTIQLSQLNSTLSDSTQLSHSTISTQISQQTLSAQLSLFDTLNFNLSTQQNSRHNSLKSTLLTQLAQSNSITKLFPLS